MMENENHLERTVEVEPGYDPGYFPAPIRQPNLGYALALLIIGFLVLALVSIGIAFLGQSAHLLPANTAKAANGLPKASILLEAVTFGVTLGIAALVFPRFWERPFGRTIEWNPAPAKRFLLPLAIGGIALSVLAQLLESFLTLPKELPVDDFFRKPSDVIVITLFGTLVAPVCEEIFFRGFLLRGFAITIEWLMTPRTDEGRLWWMTADSLSQRSMIVAGVITSGLFAAMHAPQLGFTWPAVGVLWVVGGALTAVRIYFKSVAASSVVHAVYNGWIFVVIFFATDGFRHLDKMTGH